MKKYISILFGNICHSLSPLNVLNAAAQYGNQGVPDEGTSFFERVKEKLWTN